MKKLTFILLGSLIALSCEKSKFSAKNFNNESNIVSPKEAFEATPTVVESSPCHLSQTSLVAYDISDRSFLYCNGQKWSKVPGKNEVKNGSTDQKMSYTPTTEYKLIDRDKLQALTYEKLEVKEPVPFVSKYKGPKSFKCRAVADKKAFRCKSSTNQVQLAH